MFATKERRPDGEDDARNKKESYGLFFDAIILAFCRMK